jgi:glyoxylase-like metal-dependent hydrolase (beta-lactamase superfamily II)
MQLIFEQIRAGGDRNFGYLLGDQDTGQGLLIDPSYTPEALVQRASDQGLKVTHEINTHPHPDHTNGNAKDAELTAEPVAAFANSSLVTPDLGLGDEQEFEVGGLRLQFLHMPGHCPDQLVVYEPSRRILITGDLLLVGKVGGTTNDDDARTEWTSLRRLFDRFPDEAKCGPGTTTECAPVPRLAWSVPRTRLSAVPTWPLSRRSSTAQLAVHRWGDAGGHGKPSPHRLIWDNRDGHRLRSLASTENSFDPKRPLALKVAPVGYEEAHHVPLSEYLIDGL